MVCLSDEEFRERRANVDSTLGSLALERLHPDQAALEILESFAAGELSVEDLDGAADELAARYRRAAAHAA